ncbi:MAG: protein kinase [Anaerolineae bacterium]|nr:protein kinase [Anaerolineae bacterium]
MVPSKIGRYEIKAEIGRGGMATVYRAYDPRFRREVALKLLPREFLHDTTFRARFEREAQTVAALEHAAIVPVYDFGEEGDQPYLVMRLMTGGSLAERLKSGPLSLAEATRIVKRIGLALDEAHQKGVIHRDLKPGNILFDHHDDAYLTDFGIVRLVEATASYTGSGIIGTPAYMSPEQAHGNKELDGRSDLYSLGVVLYEMLVGKPPYQADTPIRVAMRHILEPIPQIRTEKPDLPAEMEAIISHILAKEPDERYPSSSTLVADLQTVLEGGIRLDMPPTNVSGDEPPSVSQHLPSASMARVPVGNQRTRHGWNIGRLIWLVVAVICLGMAVGGVALVSMYKDAFVAATPTATVGPSGIPTITQTISLINVPTATGAFTPTIVLTATRTPRNWRPTSTCTPTATFTPSPTTPFTSTATSMTPTQAASPTPNWVLCADIGVSISCPGTLLCETHTHAWTCSGTVGSCGNPGTVDTCLEQCSAVFGSSLFKAVCTDYPAGAACYCAVTGSY